ncbi:MAG: hypothetical protein HRT52_01075 [Colwellia sp.]|nr:hypothetical protein [Colwellia sp.]
MYKKHCILVSFLWLLIACNPKPEIKSSTIKPQCLASQSKCVVTNELGQFNLLFNVEEIHGELPFELSITYDSNDNDIKFSAYLEGKDMFMGKIPVFFTKMKNENKQISEILLANCSEDNMVWRLWVTVEASTDNEKTLKLKKKKTFFIDFTSTRL